MVSMKISDEEKKEQIGLMAEQNEYPWGLQISLEDDDIEKLGIGLPALDEVLTIKCKAKVTYVTSTKRGEEREDTMRLQITDMEVEKTESKAAEKLYGG